ncbi:MAG: F0F1 ATP synthase subunit alpha, partial [Acutalibacteraceae bacterium]|nr:F0F1 ATP synthase subunit alpha [Acutalibacteraceae bacterium]
EPIVYRSGTVATVGDGVVRVKGLPDRLYGELLEFEGGVYGMALDLEEDGVGAVLMDSSDSVNVGDSVKGTGVVAEIPVGDSLLGRVIDPIGRPLDGGILDCDEHLPCERPAPKIMERRPVDKPLETGILAIDSMIPIGRGQRELIIGDRQTGKTSIAIDTIINQKNSDVICIYCAIGQKASNIAQIIGTLKAAGAMEYSLVVASAASDSPAMQYLAPYAACAVAEGFMREGKDVLVVYDDLSKHAVAYRTMSLLLHRPPGREAFPGDVFYLHSRLLERSACMSEELGGGSITALPIIETMAGNISAYIPTNVISITDGQVYLETELFHSGVRPAVNIGLSVSRVGRAAQHKAMRKASGSLRIELSQFREMAVFTRFGSDVDTTTKKMLDRGNILTELLKQPKSKPYTLFEEVALLTAYRNNIFEDAPHTEIKRLAGEMLDFLHNNCASVENAVNSTGDLDEEDANRLADSLNSFKESCLNGEHQ